MTGCLLRADDAPAPPQPGLGDLPALAAQARNNGLAAVLTMEVDDVEMSPAVELTAYRVVQESLTNVVRHAHATGVAISVRRAADQLRVEVVDDGHGPQDQPPGFGIRGMRGRVEAVGGTLETGAGADHGYAVRAYIPTGALPRPPGSVIFSGENGILHWSDSDFPGRKGQTSCRVSKTRSSWSLVPPLGSVPPRRSGWRKRAPRWWSPI